MLKTTTLVIASALAITGFVLQPGETAQAKTHRVQVVKSDIDGDGRRDTVRIDRIKTSSHYRTTYQVTVKTATGKKVSRTVGVQGWVGSGRIAKPLVGTADVDGVGGDEIALKVRSFGTPDGSQNTFAILTWRKGKLVLEKPAKGSWQGGISSTLAWDSRSYTVFDEVGGVNYALLCDSSSIDATDPAKGRITSSGPISSSVWRKGKWRAASAKQTGAIPVSRCAPDRAAGADPSVRLVLPAS